VKAVIARSDATVMRRQSSSAALLITASQLAMAALGLLILVVIADLTYRVIPSSHRGMSR
jgi:hypothetical protein